MSTPTKPKRDRNSYSPDLKNRLIDEVKKLTWIAADEYVREHVGYMKLQDHATWETVAKRLSSTEKRLSAKQCRALFGSVRRNALEEPADPEEQEETSRKYKPTPERLNFLRQCPTSYDCTALMDKHALGHQTEASTSKGQHDQTIAATFKKTVEIVNQLKLVSPEYKEFLRKLAHLSVNSQFEVFAGGNVNELFNKEQQANASTLEAANGSKGRVHSHDGCKKCLFVVEGRKYLLSEEFPQKAKDIRGHIYVYRCAKYPGQLKIGYSTDNPIARINAQALANKEEYILVALYETPLSHSTEKLVHFEMPKGSRMPGKKNAKGEPSEGRTEWFKVSYKDADVTIKRVIANLEKLLKT